MPSLLQAISVKSKRRDRRDEAPQFGAVTSLVELQAPHQATGVSYCGFHPTHHRLLESARIGWRTVDRGRKEGDFEHFELDDGATGQQRAPFRLLQHCDSRRSVFVHVYAVHGESHQAAQRKRNAHSNLERWRIQDLRHRFVHAMAERKTSNPYLPSLSRGVSWTQSL